MSSEKFIEGENVVIEGPFKKVTSGTLFCFNQDLKKAYDGPLAFIVNATKDAFVDPQNVKEIVIRFVPEKANEWDWFWRGSVEIEKHPTKP